MGEFFSTIWNEGLVHPILNLLLVMYHIMGDNLGLAVILFTLLMRLALTPLLNQQVKMSKKLQAMKPRMEEIQKKYKNNQEKLAREQMNLYKEFGYNPLGCFGSLIPQLVLIGILYYQVRLVTSGGTEGIYPFIKTWIAGEAEFRINTMFLGIDLAKDFNNIIAQCNCVNFSNLPLESILKPILTTIVGPFQSASSIPYFILAVLVGIIQYLTTLFMQKFQGHDKKDENKDSVKGKKADKTKSEEPSMEEMQAQMMKNMNLIFPVLTLVISLSYPAALGLAWLVQSLMIVVQYLVLDRKKTIDVLKSFFEIRFPKLF